MNITILGAGNMARGIGTRLVAGGNSVTLMSRDPEDGTTLAAELQAGARNGAPVQSASIGSSIRDDVVILAVPYTAEAEIIQQYSAQLPGKILVSITNPLNATYDGLATPPGSSAAEEIASDTPDLIAVAVVGDGEAETGQLEGSWKNIKFLHPVRDGAVLPILHLNEYKISGPTVFGREDDESIRQVIAGHGYEVHFVEGNDPMQMHQAFAETLETCYAHIRSIQADARTHGFTGVKERQICFV